jgi:hypothetical protein
MVRYRGGRWDVASAGIDGVLCAKAEREETSSLTNFKPNQGDASALAENCRHGGLSVLEGFPLPSVV